MERSRRLSLEGSKRPAKVMWSSGSMASSTGPMRMGSATLPLGRPESPTEKAHTGLALRTSRKRSVKSTACGVHLVM